MRVVVADDAVLVSEGVSRLLAESGFEVVGEATDAAGLLDLVWHERPDVAVVDIRMPPTYTDEGLAAAMEIRESHPGTGVLVLSQYLEPQYAMRLLEQTPSGVGYLLKERIGRVDELVDAVRRVADGECVVDRMIVKELVERRRLGDPLAELSQRERQILELMAEGRSNQGIREALWLSPKTVETHIRGLFNKLGLLNAPADNRRVLAVLVYLSSTGDSPSSTTTTQIPDRRRRRGEPHPVRRPPTHPEQRHPELPRGASRRPPLDPAAMEARNPNYVGGDINGGSGRPPAAVCPPGRPSEPSLYGGGIASCLQMARTVPAGTSR